MCRKGKEKKSKRTQLNLFSKIRFMLNFETDNIMNMNAKTLRFI